MRSPRALVLAVLVVLSLSAPVFAEQDFQEQVGFSPNHLFEAGTFGENVDITTGNLTLTVPLGPKYQLRELSHQVVLTYNAKIWDYVKPANPLSESDRKPYLKAEPTFGVGWTYHEGRIYLDDPNTTLLVPDVDIERPRRIQYEAPDGSRHALYAANAADPLAGEYFSKDNSYLKARAYTVPDPLEPADSLLVWKLSEPDGTARILGYQVGDGKVRNRRPKPMPGEALWSWSMRPADLANGWYTIRRESARKRAPESLCGGPTPDPPVPPLLAPADVEVPCTYVEYFYGGTEPASNEFSLPSRTGTFSRMRYIRDSIGRRIDILPSTLEGTATSAFFFPHINGTVVRYDLVWGGETINAPLGEGAYYDDGYGNCIEDYPSPPAVLSVTELRQIRYPGGYTMTFGYDGPSCERQGQLTRRTLPTGAVNTYEYMVYKTLEGQDFSSSLIRRTLAVAGQPDAVWEYARDPTHLGRVLEDVPANDTSLRSPTFMGTSFGPDYSEPAGGPGGALPSLFYYSNPPRVWEKDPDGNLTVYHLYTNRNDPKIGQIVYPQPEMYGSTRYMERILGGSTQGAAESATSYHYTWDPGVYNVPYDKIVLPTVDETPNESLRANLRRRATATVQITADGTYRMHRVEETDWDAYGHARTKTEYAQDSMSTVYRTTRTNWLTMPNNPDVESEDVVWNNSVLGANVVNEVQWRWNLNLVTSTEVVAGAAGAVAQRSRTLAFDRWGVPLELLDYPDPQDGTSYVRTVNLLDAYGQVTRTDVSNVGAALPAETVTTHFTRNDAGQVLYKKFGTFTWKAFDRDVDLASGLTTRTRTPAGVVTDFDYDELGRLTLIEPALPEHPTVITYPSLQLTTVSQGPTTNRIYTNYRYDQAGRLTRTEKITADGYLAAQEVRYDVAGRKVFESEWLGPAAVAPYPGTTYEYWVPLIGPRGPIAPDAEEGTYTADPLGRVTRVTTADGAVTETTYDALTRSVKVFDLNRLPGSTTDVSPAPDSTLTLFTSDVFGRLTRVDGPPGGEDAVYAYDILDNLVRVEMGTQVRTFVYDGLGRLKQASNPENGLVTFDDYGPTGLLKRKTEDSGARTYWMHDAAGRVVLERYGADYFTSRGYAYDTPLGGSQDRAAGRLVAVERNGPDGGLDVRRELIYAGLNGRLSEERTSFGTAGPVAYATRLEYNNFGLPSTLRYPEAMPVAGFAPEVTFDYKNGFLIRVGEGTNAGHFVLDVSYNAAGGKQLVKYGNGTWTEIIPDTRNRPSRVDVKVSQPVAENSGGEGEAAPRLAQGALSPYANSILAAWARSQAADGFGRSPGLDAPGTIPRLPVDLLALAQIEIDCELAPESCGGGGGGAPPHVAWDSGLYVYDGAGNIIGIGADWFRYDAHGRLTTASLQDLPGTGPGASAATQTWSYDGFGNMLSSSKQVPGGDLFTYGFTVSEHNRIEQIQFTTPDAALNFTRSAAYDAVGNMTSDGQRQMVWDPLGRLREVRHTDGTLLGRFGYDDRDYRSRKVEDGFETFYIRDPEGRVLSEFRRPEGSAMPPAWDQAYVYALGQAVATVKNDAPEAPEELQLGFTADPGLNVSLYWKRNTEGDVWGYRVYRRPYPGTGSFTQLGTPGGVSILDAGQPDPVVFQDNPPGGCEYYVTTLDTAGYESGHSRHLALDPGATFPVAVEWGQPAVIEGDESLELRFYVEADALLVNGYQVYRRLAGEASFALITPSLLLQPGYLDTGLDNDQTYEYKVVALTTTGAEPDLGAAPVQSGTPRDLVPPSPPTGVRAMPGAGWGQIRVSWTRSNSHDVAGYRLYEMEGTTATLLPDSIPATASSLGIQLTGSSIYGVTRSYQVTAFDDATSPSGPNESTPSPTVTARTWASSGTYVYEYTMAAYRKILEFGEKRDDSSNLGPEPYLYQSWNGRMEHAQPVQYRAARLIPGRGSTQCYPLVEDYPTFGCPDEEFLGFNIYRSACPDEEGEIAGDVELLTPEPYFELDNHWELKPFLDVSPPGLCHIYYLSAVGEGPNGVHLETGVVSETRGGVLQPGLMYSYGYGPTEIMGQYAYGARLTRTTQEGDLSHYDTIAIHPDGGWELGSALPGTPVVLRWRKSPHPETTGYRIWVRDDSRCPFVPYANGWCLLGEEDLGPLDTTFLDYGAPKGWPVLDPDGNLNYKSWNSCHVGMGANLELGVCPCRPGYRPLAEYFVEGTTVNSPPRTPAYAPSHALWDQGFLWTDRARAIRLEEANGGICPTGPGQELYHACCNGDFGACNSYVQPNPQTPDCQPQGGGDLSLPASPLPAVPELAEPALVAEFGRSGEAEGPAPFRPVLGELVIHEGAPEPSRAAVTMPAPDRLVGQLVTPSTTHWLHGDHLGSTRVVTDTNGAVVSKHKYLPFGEEYGSFGAPATNTHKFTGHERDEETGLDYMMARYYGNSLGRFLSVDPGDDTDPEKPQKWNSYVYVSSNPVRLLDPDGMIEKEGGLIRLEHEAAGNPNQPKGTGTTTFGLGVEVVTPAGGGSLSVGLALDSNGGIALTASFQAVPPGQPALLAGAGPQIAYTPGDVTQLEAASQQTTVAAPVVSVTSESGGGGSVSPPAGKFSPSVGAGVYQSFGGTTALTLREPRAASESTATPPASQPSPSIQPIIRPAEPNRR